MVYINSELGPAYQLEKTAVTLGNFDSLHQGHMQLINGVIKAKGLNSVVFSFYPHPVAVLGGREIQLIYSRDEKKALLEKLGIDYYIEYPFTKAFASMTPGAFIRDILKERLDCRYLVVGEGYRFGKERSGSIEVIKEICRNICPEPIEVEAVPHFMHGSQKISSSAIRTQIASGSIGAANALIGRPYMITGKVITGKQLGRRLGFPTVNIVPPAHKLLPPNGVYVSGVYRKDGTLYYKGVTNIGNNPTVGGSGKTVETYIFDFQEDIYGETITVEFNKWLRREIKFGNIQELKNQIDNDSANVRCYFEAVGAGVLL